MQNHPAPYRSATQQSVGVSRVCSSSRAQRGKDVVYHVRWLAAHVSLGACTGSIPVTRACSNKHNARQSGGCCAGKTPVFSGAFQSRGLHLDSVLRVETSAPHCRYYHVPFELGPRSLRTVSVAHLGLDGLWTDGWPRRPSRHIVEWPGWPSSR